MFEGILAFANKELLKVLLPGGADGCAGCVVWEGCHRVLWVVWGLPWYSPWWHWGWAMAGGCGGRHYQGLVAEHLCARASEVPLLGAGSEAGLTGGAKGMLTPPSFPAPGHESVCGHGL